MTGLIHWFKINPSLAQCATGMMPERFSLWKPTCMSMSMSTALLSSHTLMTNGPPECEPSLLMKSPYSLSSCCMHATSSGTLGWSVHCFVLEQPSSGTWQIHPNRHAAASSGAGGHNTFQASVYNAIGLPHPECSAKLAASSWPASSC